MFTTATGAGAADFAGTRISSGTGIAGWVASTGQPMALSGLWEGLFARNPARLRHAGKLLYKRIALAIGDPVMPALATPEHLQSIVLQLRGEAR